MIRFFFSLIAPRRCPDCKGSGRPQGYSNAVYLGNPEIGFTPVCERCKGKGYVRFPFF